MTVADGCYACCSRTGAATLYRVRVEEQEAHSTDRLRRRVPRRLRRGALLGPPAVECLRFGVACGAESTQHFGAGILDPTRVDRLYSEVEAERLETTAEIG